MAGLFGFTGGWVDSLRSGWAWLIWVLILGGFFTLIITTLKNKMTYKYPVRIFKIRDGSKVKESNYWGGYLSRKNSAPFFRIKTGRFWWQYIDLSTTPNPAYMDEQDRIYYKQIDVKTFVQLQREFPLNPKNKLVYNPVECDVKYGAILDIHSVKEVLRAENKWQKVAPYMALVLIFIAAILGWWFVMDSKCPGVG